MQDKYDVMCFFILIGLLLGSTLYYVPHIIELRNDNSDNLIKINEYQNRIAVLEYNFSQAEIRINNMIMINTSLYNLTFNTSILGSAYGEFFLVWTKDRDITSVLETCTHEYAHNNLDMGHNKDIRELKNKIHALQEDTT